jgi:hypothetical protein
MRAILQLSAFKPIARRELALPDHPQPSLGQFEPSLLVGGIPGIIGHPLAFRRVSPVLV